MSKRAAPYRHEDGGNCWTKNCSRGNFFVGTSAPTFTVKDFYSEVKDPQYAADLDYLRALIDTPTTVEAKPATGSGAITPVHSGAELNARHTFRNRLPKPYDPAEHGPVQNLGDDDASWTKPLGAFWISTVDEEDGLSGWDRLWGNRKEARRHSGKHEHAVKFKDDAKVLVIDSLADYEALLTRYPHYSGIKPSEDRRRFGLYGGAFSVFSPQGEVRRGLDWERLAADYDGLFLTHRGQRACGGKDYTQSHAPKPSDLSLYAWDFESAIVFHPQAVVVTRES